MYLLVKPPASAMPGHRVAAELPKFQKLLAEQEGMIEQAQEAVDQTKFVALSCGRWHFAILGQYFAFLFSWSRLSNPTSRGFRNGGMNFPVRFAQSGVYPFAPRRFTCVS